VTTAERRPATTLTDCRAASRRIRATPDGRRTLDSLRPRGVPGVFRDRMPVSLLLYTAGLEHRLVWQDDRGFALLEPPLARPEIWRRHRPGAVGALRWVDAQWNLLAFAAPLVGLLALSAVLALGLGQLLAASLVVLTAMVYVTAVVTSQVVGQLITVWRQTPQKNALGSVTGDRWTMPLFHQENDRRIDELLDRVEHRLGDLVRFEAEQAARDRGAEVGTARTSAGLARPHAGATTQAARSRIAARYPIVHDSVSLSDSDRRPDDPGTRPYRPIPFVLTYLTGVVVVIAGLAEFIAGHERDACAPDRCSAAPSTYPDALFWAFYRLIGVNTPGIVPASGQSLALGWLITFMGLIGVVVVGVAFSTYIRRSREETTIIKDQLMTRGRTRLLLVTVADEECEAVLDAVEQHVGRPLAARFDGFVPVYEPGTINDTEIFVVQASQGVTNAGGALLTTTEAIRQIDPHYALIVGMCYGLRPDEQEIGDILVSEKIADLDPGKIIDRDAGSFASEPVEIRRGTVVDPSTMLVTAIKAARRQWVRAVPSSRVRVGPMLAWGKLVNSRATVQRLRAEHPDGIGAEMEGAGFYAAARAGRVECVLVKAICDWGFGRETDQNELEAAKETACRNSAAFVLHLVLTGVFSRSPAERAGR
jgi:nucleoside phosphorylase